MNQGGSPLITRYGLSKEPGPSLKKGERKNPVFNGPTKPS